MADATTSPTPTPSGGFDYGNALSEAVKGLIDVKVAKAQGKAATSAAKLAAANSSASPLAPAPSGISSKVIIFGAVGVGLLVVLLVVMKRK